MTAPNNAELRTIEGSPLNEMDEDEFCSVALKLCPGLSREKYEAMWVDFQKAKSEHELRKQMQ